MVRLSLTCLLVMALFGAASARADARADDCDDMTRVDDVPSPVGRLVERELILPCAVVDSGVVGPGCGHADFYVVNLQGTVLCRVDVAVLAVTATPMSIDEAPSGAPSSSSVDVMSPAASHAVIAAFAIPLVTDVLTAKPPRALDEGLDLVFGQLRPS